MTQWARKTAAVIARAVSPKQSMFFSGLLRLCLAMTSREAAKQSRENPRYFFKLCLQIEIMMAIFAITNNK
jgi:hypothetical protein